MSEWIAPTVAQSCPTGIDGLFCTLVDGLDAYTLENDAILWQALQADRLLAPSEQAAWQSLPCGGPRRATWLMGRVAAKAAVCRWAAQWGLDPAPSTIILHNSPQGRPFVSWGATAPANLGLPAVSIAHTRWMAAAVAGPPPTQVGVDVEWYPEHHAPLLRTIFSPQEQRLLLAAGGDYESALLHLWCAKEAAAKASGQGLTGRPQNWPIVAYGLHTPPISAMQTTPPNHPPTTGWATVFHNDTQYPVEWQQTGPRVLAFCRLHPPQATG